jgi:hypothetical protein
MNAACRKYFVGMLIFLVSAFRVSASSKPTEFVTIAILAKDKAHTLPLYLECLEAQTWPASNTYLYIRTNNNNDETAQILRDWIARVGEKYPKIYFDDADVAEQVQQFGQHEWNCTRFKVLGKIRQDSVDWARENNSHYFVADCDNFIYPETIEEMLKTNVPIVAPLLRCYEEEKHYYSNYHDALDSNGYYIPSVFYYDIIDQRVKGIIEVLLVHCTYFIRREVLDTVCYDDESWRYEYVIFSHSARRQNIPQYIDNRKIYGYVSFAENREDFEKESYATYFKE